MSLLSFFAGKPVTPEQASTLVAPYNAVSPLALPRVYAHDQATHPDVLDFGVDPAGWFGKDPRRYWMAFTPFPPAGHENPSILCSHDGITWTTPTGLTNPIEGTPPGGSYNSDTDLVFDPIAKRLGCVWRTFYTAGNNLPDKDSTQLYIKWSSDGITWGEKLSMISNILNKDMGVAPCVIREDDGTWTMFTCISGGISRWTAATPTGPWVPTPGLTVSGPYADQKLMAWHANVIRHRGQYRMLMRATNGKFYAAVSENGIQWRFGDTLMESVHPWEMGSDGTSQMYRATFTPHDNNADYRVWYGAAGANPGWRIAYTEIPQREWSKLG